MKKKALGLTIILTGTLLISACKSDEMDSDLKIPVTEPVISTDSNTESVTTTEPASEPPITTVVPVTEPVITSHSETKPVTTRIPVTEPAVTTTVSMTEPVVTTTDSGTEPFMTVTFTMSEPEVTEEWWPELETDFSNMTVETEFPEYTTDTKSIKIFLTDNNFGRTFSYCDVPFIERFENGEWKELLYTPDELYYEAMWPITIAYYDKPATTMVLFHTQDLQDELIPGEYRMVVLVGRNSMDYEKLYAPFRVVEAEN